MTAKKGTKDFIGGGSNDDSLRVKDSSVGEKNKLLKAELAFLSITALG